MFSGAPFRWWIAGGHALELHTGRSWREHDDLDVGVCRQAIDEALGWLDGWDFQVRTNNVWARRTTDDRWALDLTIGGGNEENWIYRRDPLVTRSWHEAVLRTAGGVPYLAPDLQLLFKSKDLRPKDDLDAAEVIPGLTPDQLKFLSDHLDSQHPWRRLLLS